MLYTIHSYYDVDIYILIKIDWAGVTHRQARHYKLRGEICKDIFLKLDTFYTCIIYHRLIVLYLCVVTSERT